MVVEIIQALFSSYFFSLRCMYLCANCKLIVNHLLVDFNRISHTFVSPCISIRNGFKEINCDYTVGFEKHSLPAQYCVSNLIRYSLFVFSVHCICLWLVYVSTYTHIHFRIIIRIHSNQNHCLGSSALSMDTD